MQRHKHFLIKPQAITNAASHQAAQREYNDKDNDNDRAREETEIKGEKENYNDDDTSHSLHSKWHAKSEYGGGGGVAMPNLGSPKMRGKCSPHTHTHTLPWLWLCATLIDVPAKPASPRHATPPASTDCCCLYVYGCDCLASATDIDFHTRATAGEAAAAAKMLQQDDSSTWAKNLPQFSNYSQNFMPTKATHSMHRQPQGSVPHTQMELVGRQVLCNIFGLPLPAAVATKTNLCSCAAHSNTTSNVHVCVRVCVSSKFYISSIFVSFAGKNAWQKFFKRCQHPSLSLAWLSLHFDFVSLPLSLPLSLISGTFLQTLFQPVFQSR